jgi:hypothetical protein
MVLALLAILRLIAHEVRNLTDELTRKRKRR